MDIDIESGLTLQTLLRSTRFHDHIDSNWIGVGGKNSIGNPVAFSSWTRNSVNDLSGPIYIVGWFWRKRRARERAKKEENFPSQAGNNCDRFSKLLKLKQVRGEACERIWLGRIVDRIFQVQSSVSWCLEILIEWWTGSCLLLDCCRVIWEAKEELSIRKPLRKHGKKSIVWKGAVCTRFNRGNIVS